MAETRSAGSEGRPGTPGRPDVTPREVPRDPVTGTPAAPEGASARKPDAKKRSEDLEQDIRHTRAELSERFDPATICLNIEDTPAADDAEVADWEIAPNVRLSGDASAIPVLVNERACASGDTAEGRIVHDVEYGQDTVTVTIRVIPKGGPQNCPSNPNTEYVVELDESLDGRELLDGGVTPAAPPHLGD